MLVNGLDHVNICTRDVASSARFYAELFDLEARNAPPPMPADVVQWMYTESGQAIVHLYKQDREPGSTGIIHHVALNCSGKDQILERLQKRGAHYDIKQDPSGWVIYTKDPHGLMLELYFPNG